MAGDHPAEELRRCHGPETWEEKAAHWGIVATLQRSTSKIPRGKIVRKYWKTTVHDFFLNIFLGVLYTNQTWLLLLDFKQETWRLMPPKYSEFPPRKKHDSRDPPELGWNIYQELRTEPYDWPRWATTYGTIMLQFIRGSGDASSKVALSPSKRPKLRIQSKLWTSRKLQAGPSSLGRFGCETFRAGWKSLGQKRSIGHLPAKIRRDLTTRKSWGCPTIAADYFMLFVDFTRYLPTVIGDK